MTTKHNWNPLQEVSSSAILVKYNYPAQPSRLVSNKSKMADYYEIVGVSSDATFDIIKATYRQKARVLHPDKNHASDATEAFQRLGHAWDTLRDEKRRGLYDHQLSAEKLKHRQSAPVSSFPEPAKAPYTFYQHDNYGKEENPFFFFENLKDFPLVDSFRFYAPEHPDKPLRTGDDIANAHVDLRQMKTEYNIKLKNTARASKATYATRNVQQSEKDAMQYARGRWEMVQYWAEITAFEEAITERFEELVRESLESMEL